VSAPAPLIGLVEDSEEDFAALSRIVSRDAPGTQLRRWPRAEAVLETLAGITDADADAWPSVLIVDLNLPGIDGCELVRRLRASETTRSIPVFVLSGSDRQADIDRCYAAGANAYLTKPGSASELRALVQMVLRSLTLFKVPTPLTAVATDLDTSAPASIDEARDDYERHLMAERDAERRGRERAEALQRLTSRLADLMNVSQIESALAGELVGGGAAVKADVIRADVTTPPSGATYVPELSGGTVGLLPMVGASGTAAATLQVRLDSEPGVDDRAFLQAAAEIGARAFERVAKVAVATRRASRDLHDLPNRKWWLQGLDRELRDAARSRQPLVAALIELIGFQEYLETHGHVAGDQLVLTVSEAWRRAGHDLMSPFGGDDFGAIMTQCSLPRAKAVVDEIHRIPRMRRAFAVGLVEWNGREDAAGLTARCEAALLAERRRRAAVGGG
jgi:PleD family two-component response regulator